MKIKNKKTDIEYDISTKEWDKMKGSGESRKYTVVNSGETTAKAPPKQLKPYDVKLKEANKLYKEESFKESLILFEEVFAIKETKAVKDKIIELTEKTN